MTAGAPTFGAANRWGSLVATEPIQRLVLFVWPRLRVSRWRRPLPGLL